MVALWGRRPAPIRTTLPPSPELSSSSELSPSVDLSPSPELSSSSELSPSVDLSRSEDLSPSVELLEPPSTGIIARERGRALLYDRSNYDKPVIKVIKESSTDQYENHIEPGYEETFINSTHTKYLEDLVNKAHEAQTKGEAQEKEERNDVAKTFFEKRLCSKPMKTDYFGNKRIIWRIVFIHEKDDGCEIVRGHFTNPQHKVFCTSLRIDSFERLEPGAWQPQDEASPVLQAHDATIKTKDPPSTAGRREVESKLRKNLDFTERRDLPQVSQPIIPNTPSSSKHSAPQQHTGLAKGSEALKSTKIASAPTVTFYKPGDGSGKYCHVATDVGAFKSEKNDDTPCIVENLSQKNDFRLWSWAHAKELCVKNDTQTYKWGPNKKDKNPNEKDKNLNKKDENLDKEYKNLDKTLDKQDDNQAKEDRERVPNIERQFHLPDSEWIGAKGRLSSTEFSVITTLTWRVKATKSKKTKGKHAEIREIRNGYEYYNSVLFELFGEKKDKAQKLREQQDCVYKGPFRCSISEFRRIASGEEALKKLQLDTEAGEGYLRYWEGRQKVLENRRLRARSRTPAATEATKLQKENKELRVGMNNANERNKYWAEVLAKSGISA
jgi:hypothetical protein